MDLANTNQRQQHRWLTDRHRHPDLLSTGDGNISSISATGQVRPCSGYRGIAVDHETPSPGKSAITIDLPSARASGLLSHSGRLPRRPNLRAPIHDQTRHREQSDEKHDNEKRDRPAIPTCQQPRPSTPSTRTPHAKATSRRGCAITSWRTRVSRYPHHAAPVIGFAAESSSEFVNPRDLPRNGSIGLVNCAVTVVPGTPDSATSAS
jgi:hypothetical protein